MSRVTGTKTKQGNGLKDNSKRLYTVHYKKVPDIFDFAGHRRVLKLLNKKKKKHFHY